MGKMHFWELPKETMTLLRGNSSFIKIEGVDKSKEHLIEKIKFRKIGKPISIIFPINFLIEEWAVITGALLSEGSIFDKQGIGFWNKDPELMEKFIKILKKVVKSGFREDKDNFGCLLPQIFTKILNTGLELKSGDKIKNDIGVPEIFLNSDDEKLSSALLSWLFSGDGWITVFKDHLNQLHRAIGIGFCSIEKDKISRLLSDTTKMLDKFDIRFSRPFQEIGVTKRGVIFFNWKIFIKGKNNLIKFRDKINFQTKSKREILDKAIASFVRPKRSDNESLFLVADAVRESCFEFGFSTKHDVMQLTDLKESWVLRLLKKALDKGMIKVIGGGNRRVGFRGGRYPYFYGIKTECEKI